MLLAAVFAFTSVFTLSYPSLISKLLFRMPQPSGTFDCDDSTALMAKRFNSIGIKTTPLLGNLKVDGESYSESDHVWVLASVAGLHIAFDWGIPYFDKQHYEGYTLTSDQLLFFVNQDVIAQGLPAAAALP